MNGDRFGVEDGKLTGYQGRTVPCDCLSDIAFSLPDGVYEFDEHDQVHQVPDEPTPEEMVERRLAHQQEAVKTLDDAVKYLQDYRLCAKVLRWNYRPQVVIYCAHECEADGPLSLLYWARLLEYGDAPAYVKSGVFLWPVGATRDYDPTSRDLGPGSTARYGPTGLLGGSIDRGGWVSAYGSKVQALSHTMICGQCPTKVDVRYETFYEIIENAYRLGQDSLDLRTMQVRLSERPGHADMGNIT